jgi:hypothetical protein
MRTRTRTPQNGTMLPCSTWGDWHVFQATQPTQHKIPRPS